MAPDGEGFFYPQIDVSRCVDCGLCEKVCPVLNPVPENTETKAFAAYSVNEEVRENSSSGGIFTELASAVVQKGGVVFGAALDDSLTCFHCWAENREQLAQFQGSKYVQSRIGDAYNQAKAFLDTGRLVLFTGTPCQVEGLLSFLQKPYPNLLTQDIICHGVPSPAVWDRYVAYREKRSGAGAKAVFFRDKNSGWQTYSLSMEFKKGKRYKERLDLDPYMRAFLNNLSLRPSCYRCHFKKKQRPSDITLADLWGAERIVPDMDDDKGTSLVIAHSAKGAALFESISSAVISRPTDLSGALQYNTAMTCSVAMPRSRAAFFDAFRENRLPFPGLANRFCSDSWLKLHLRKLKHSLTKIRKGK